MIHRPQQPWAQSWENVLEGLEVSAETGLSLVEVESRRRQFGENRLTERKRKSVWWILSEQFKGLIVLLLLVAAALAFAFQEWVEAVAILVVLFINAAIGFVMEWKAYRSMEALHRLGMITTRVRREGRSEQIPASDLVPGDIVVVEGGDMVSADLRLMEASKLLADESAMTGESFPVEKMAKPLPADVHPAERSNMLFRGTSLTRGAGTGVVVATGMQTELGKVSALVEEAEAERTPLEKRLVELGRRLIWITLAIAAGVTLSGILTDKPVFLMVETAIALAVATIPEGLPIVTNIALAQGMWRMARRNALINRLSAVETLGATTLICTDKTGTLTENRMTVVRLALDFGDVEVPGGSFPGEGEFRTKENLLRSSEDLLVRQILETGILCNNASLRKTTVGGKPGAVGDPLEIALLVAGAKAGLEREELLKALPEVREEAFDPDVRMMATFHQWENQCRVAVKGAPESVLDVCTHVATEPGPRPLTPEERSRWLTRSSAMAHEGLRVLALATKVVSAASAKPYEGLTLLGLVGVSDPPRADVRPAIDSCRRAGIRVVMVTGDQPATGRQIALAVGLPGVEDGDVIHGRDLQLREEVSKEERERLLQAPIFARLTPKQKLDLIALHQKSGSVVAMTGDGVNDAPALRKADIGVAMGVRGTQVACQAADMVLKDDSFATIVAAIAQGRVIFSNIRKFVFYLLSCNVSEVLVVGLASLARAPLPILPLQILFLNLVTDVFPALALGAGRGDPDVMEKSPRDPKEPILTRRHWAGIAGYGLLITACVLGTFAGALLWLKMPEEKAITVSFLTLAFAQLFHIFNMRAAGSRLLQNEIVRDPFVWGALVLCAGLLLAAVYLPGLAAVMNLYDPGKTGWALVSVMSLLPAVVGQVIISWRWFRLSF